MSVKSRLLSPLVLVAVIGCASPASFPAVAGPEPVPRLAGLAGTYTLAVCREAPCVPGDTARAYLVGMLVLVDRASAEAAELPPARLEAEPRANACFLTTYRRRVEGSYAGITPREYVRWSVHGDSISFPLYRSPDAGYVASVRMTTRGLVGGGISWGVGAARIRAVRDTVIATRTGPPDRLRCHVPG